MTHEKKTALVLLFDGVEEIEVITPIDLLRRAGVQVTVAAMEDQPTVVGRTDISITADTTVGKVDQSAFDVVVFPGGPGVGPVRAKSIAAEIAAKQASAGRILAAICAAPTILKDAGLLDGRRHTAHFSVKEELPELQEDSPVVIDGNIITSRGAGTAIPFALAIIRSLVSEDAAHEVAASICYHE